MGQKVVDNMVIHGTTSIILDSYQLLSTFTMVCCWLLLGEGNDDLSWTWPMPQSPGIDENWDG